MEFLPKRLCAPTKHAAAPCVRIWRVVHTHVASAYRTRAIRYRLLDCAVVHFRMARTSSDTLLARQGHDSWHTLPHPSSDISAGAQPSAPSRSSLLPRRQG
jgi:hypothetical protein